MTELDADLYALHLAAARSKARRRGSSAITRENASHDVTLALQRRLNQLGYAVEEDGRFYDRTEEAVRQLQRDSGLKPDGMVGPRTLKALRKSEGRPTLGAADPTIDAIMQHTDDKTGVSHARGTATGAREGARGVYDPGSVGQARGGRSVASEGTSRGSRGTRKGGHGGAIDPGTGLERATSTTGPIGSTEVSTPSDYSFESKHPRGPGGVWIAKGSDGQQVRRSQRDLNRSGASLRVDGRFGPKTEAAVESYQRRRGLKADGIVGPITFRALRKEGK